MPHPKLVVGRQKKKEIWIWEVGEKEETKVVFINIFFFAKKLKVGRESLEQLAEAEFQLATVCHLLNTDHKIPMLEYHRFWKRARVKSKVIFPITHAQMIAGESFPERFKLVSRNISQQRLERVREAAVSTFLHQFPLSNLQPVQTRAAASRGRSIGANWGKELNFQPGLLKASRDGS